MHFSAVAVLFAALGGCDRDDARAFPASGTYEVAVRVIDDACDPAYVAPEPWRSRLLVQAEGERGKVNLPFTAVVPNGGLQSSARSDFVLAPGYEVRHHDTPCAGASIELQSKLERFATDEIVIGTHVTYGAGACGPSSPTSCSMAIETTYTLVESECPAACTRELRAARSGGPVGAIEWVVDCRCPD